MIREEANPKLHGKNVIQLEYLGIAIITREFQVG